jgi:iron complex transport system ATP-binding protein
VIVVLFELHDIAYRYGEKSVLEDISVALAPGRFYGLIGPNGCGKTTLLDLLIRHRVPHSGRIDFQDRPLSHWSKKGLSTRIALVPQNFYINFPFCARDVVMMGRYPHIPRFSPPSQADERLVDAIMERTAVTAFEDRLVTELSGGERQRVVFARALAQDTPVLFLDEATSNLDVNHALALLKAAADLVRTEGKTVVAVMQDINLAAMYCEYLIFMKNGRIFDHGPIETILTADMLRTIFAVDAKVFKDDYTGCRQVIFRK